jgi:hypothetical protein
MLRRAVGIYATSAVLGLVIMAAAVAAGATGGLSPTAALAQLGFVALLATLTLGAVIAVARAGLYMLGKLGT